MHDETKVWLDQIRPTLPPEALPLAASLAVLASSMDSEVKENGRVSGALSSAYRMTHAAVCEALKASQTPNDDNDADLFGPGDPR